MTDVSGAPERPKSLKISLAESPFAQRLVRRMVTFSWSRKALNAAYARLTPSQKSQFHLAYSRLFRTREVRGVNGFWEVSFLGKKILMPLTDGRLWLDWDTAVSIVAHDLEIKETYAAIIDSPERPSLFVDIGANYGTHSLLFLSHGIKTLTFEPNSSCHAYFKGLCALNGVQPDLEPVALGATEGHIDLSYPERDTWSGSTDSEVVGNLAKSEKLITERVSLRTLDDYVNRISGEKVVIKIDTEGNELNVLRGASKTLNIARPKVLFESVRRSDRPALFDLFSSLQYDLHLLPWTPGQAGPLLLREPFMTCTGTNFIAVPGTKR
jgi:FkbM family methyltransferase